jgi:predicted phage tail protein
MKQKFNPEALKIAKELLDITPIAATISMNVQAMDELRNEIKDELMEKSKELRKIAKDGDRKLTKMKENAKEEVDKAREVHNAIIARIREAQPELKDKEFRMDLDEGTFTPYGPLGCDPREGENGEEIPLDVQTVMNALFDKVFNKRL